jgi:hypothetical protein
MAGISKVAEVKYEDILLANFLGEIVNSCPIRAACGEATSIGETLLGMKALAFMALGSYKFSCSRFAHSSVVE